MISTTRRHANLKPTRVRDAQAGWRHSSPFWSVCIALEATRGRRRHLRPITPPNTVICQSSSSPALVELNSPSTEARLQSFLHTDQNPRHVQRDRTTPDVGLHGSVLGALSMAAVVDATTPAVAVSPTLSGIGTAEWLREPPEFPERADSIKSRNLGDVSANACVSVHIVLMRCTNSQMLGKGSEASDEVQFNKFFEFSACVCARVFLLHV